ncbi:MAG: hypothetical protein ACFB0Z_15355 [Candidatus Phaeomarinobacter sp.]
MDASAHIIEDPKAEPERRSRVLVLCDGEGTRNALAHSFGPGYADVDPAALAQRLAEERDWDIIRAHIYVSSDASDDTRRWANRVKQTQAKLVTQPGDIRIRMALAGTQALGARQSDILLVMGADASFMALAQDTRTAARAQNRDIKFASAFAPSSHTLGRSVPSADYAVTIDRASAEKSLLLASGTSSPRRVYAGTSKPARLTPQANASATAPPAKRRLMRAVYGVGFVASMMALIWEDVVLGGGTQALDWDGWRWGVSTALALGKSIVWPLYWLARAFGIEAG